MTELEQRKAAQAFADKWLQKKGYEKGETHVFWMDLLQNVLGVSQPSEIIKFEVPIQLADPDQGDADKHISFIDAVIPATRVLIEQKSASRDLSKKTKQSDGESLSPFEQARRYDEHLPVSQHARYIVVCNFRRFEIYDREYPQAEPTVITLDSLAQNVYRLKFLAAPSDSISPEKKEISVKAGEIVSELYDKLLARYVDPSSPATLQSLNKLCVRLVFCLYAEDAELFNTHTQFRDYLAGAEPNMIRTLLRDLFRVLNTKDEERDPYERPELLAFPYINGGLFSDDDIEIPMFNEEIVDLLLNKASASFKWRDISPTIFGALFESTLNPETRRQGGMHYTSVENIHKVIDPLFLDALKAEFRDILNLKSVGPRGRQLERFHEKLASLQFLDPACGSGNFLTETYLSLRRLENDVIRSLYTDSSLSAEVFNPIKVSIGQFYGIEINDFAVTVARTALWIAESQMMQETIDIVGHELDFLPLKSYPNITEANALTLPWEQVLPAAECSYVMGNPPFGGINTTNDEQKKQLQSVYPVNYKIGKADFVTAWFVKAAQYMKANINCHTAFVSTNSICQGQQVPILWNLLLGKGIYINFAYTTFPWDNEAADKASVFCVIVGFSYQQGTTSKLFKSAADGSFVPQEIKRISPYLIEEPTCTIVQESKTALSAPHNIIVGNLIADNGYLIVDREEGELFVAAQPTARKFLRYLIGSQELMDSTLRMCLWLKEEDRNEWKQYPFINERVESCRKWREQQKESGNAFKLSKTPWRFLRQFNPPSAIVIPRVSSELRAYLPVGFIDAQTIVSDSAYLLPDATLIDLAVLSSHIHIVWMRLTSGRLKSDYRYSRDYTYNTFIWPELTPQQQQTLEGLAQKIIDFCKQATADPNSKMTLGKLYNPESMPHELKELFAQLDSVVEQAYRPEPFKNDDERLSFLLGLYNQRINELKAQETAKARAKRIRSAATKAKATDADQPAKKAKRSRKATQA